MNNLARSPAYASTIAALREQMITELKQQGDPRMFGDGAVFDSYPYSDSRTDHFYERYKAGEKLPAGWVRPTDFEKTPLE